MLAARAVRPPRPEGAAVAVFVRTDHHRMPLEAELHEVYEVTVVLRGRVERHYEGLAFEMRQGSVCLNAAWEPHGWRSLEPDTRVVSVHFLFPFLGDSRFDDTPWLALFATPPRHRPRGGSPDVSDVALPLAEAFARTIPTVVWEQRGQVPGEDGSAETLLVSSRQIYSDDADLPPAWEMGVRLDVLRILLSLYRSWELRAAGGKLPLGRPTDLSQVLPAVNLCMQASRRVGAAEAAAACHLSLTRFRDVFRSTMGLPFGQFELRRRLGSAVQSLLNTSLSVEAIAAQFGFTDGAHMHRAFRRSYGMGPTEYRATHRPAVTD